MASGVSQAQEYDISSVVRGNHVQNVVWTPINGEQLLIEKKEGNKNNPFPSALALNKFTNSTRTK